MDLSIEQIKHLAKLSKIALSPEEEQKYAQQLGSILSFLDTLTLEEKEGTPTEWEREIDLFTEQNDYPDPSSLLQNTKHPIQQNTIAIKTSLTN